MAGFVIGLIAGIFCTLIFCAMALKNSWCDGKKCDSKMLKKPD